MSNIKMSDRPLWIDRNGHKTLDNWSKQAMAYYHVEDIKCLREDATAMAEQIKELKAALESIKTHQVTLAGDSEMILSKLAVYQIAVEALKEKGK